MPPAIAPARRADSMITPVRPNAPTTTSAIVISSVTGGCFTTSTTIGGC
jgi:hypothetical protein